MHFPTEFCLREGKTDEEVIGKGLMKVTKY